MSELRSTSDAVEEAPECPAKDRPWVLAATILASAMAFIDGALTPIALPSIAEDLDAAFADLQWITTLYLLTLSALLVVGGGLGDRVGRRRIFSIGVLAFAVASAACAAAQTAEQLIAARGAQGVGAALMIPQSLAIISASYPRAERGAAIGLWASASALTTSLGPVVGGLLVDSLGWRAAFWLNLPVAAICLAITQSRMPETRLDGLSSAGWRGVDWLGASLIAVGLGGASWAMIAAPDQGVDALVVVALVAGGLAFAALPWVERRAAAPIAPPGLVAAPAFLVANLVTFLLYGALSAALFLTPMELIGARGFSVAEAGMAMLPFGLVIGLLSQPAGRLGDRVGPRAMLTLGGALFAVASIGLAALPSFDARYVASFGPALMLMGAAMAVSIAPVTTAAMNAAPDALAGAASGLNNAVSRAAGLVAVAGVGAIVAAAYRRAYDAASAAGVDPNAPAALADAIASRAGGALVTEAMSVGYLTCAALGLAAAIAARALPTRP